MPIKAVCVLKGDVSGTVFFSQRDEKSPVVLSGEVSGLKKGRHGFHIHDYGDVTGAGGSTAGGHFNPTGSQHGAPDAETRHVGDLGNIDTRADNRPTRVYISDSNISLVGPNSIVGRSLVIKANPDDLGRGGNEQSKIDGNAGARVAVGVIGIADSGYIKTAQ